MKKWKALLMGISIQFNFAFVLDAVLTRWGIPKPLPFGWAVLWMTSMMWIPTVVATWLTKNRKTESE